MNARLRLWIVAIFCGGLFLLPVRPASEHAAPLQVSVTQAQSTQPYKHDLPDDQIAPPASSRTTATSALRGGVTPIYFVPRDVTPDLRKVDLIDNRMQWVRSWYGLQLGGKTFGLNPTITITGEHELDWYYQLHNDMQPDDWSILVWHNIMGELGSRGYSWVPGNIVGVFLDHRGRGGPALGSGNGSYGMFLFSADRLVDDCREVECRSSIDDGGIAHELGHGFGLGHTVDGTQYDNSVMGYGFYYFPNDTFVNTTLSPERETLLQHPLLTSTLAYDSTSFEGEMGGWRISSPITPTFSSLRHSGLKALRLPETDASYGVTSRSGTTKNGGDYRYDLWINLGGGVILYSEPNYGGVAETLIGDTANLDDLAIGSDRVQSLRVLPGHSATLYPDIWFDGLAETFTADDPDLSDNPIRVNSVGSVRVSHSSHTLPPDLDLSLQIESLSNNGVPVGVFQQVDISDAFGRGWVHIAGSTGPVMGPGQRAGLAIRVRRLPPGYVILLDDAIMYDLMRGSDPRLDIPRPYQQFVSDPMPFNSNQPALSWHDTPTAMAYQVQVADNPAFVEPLVDAVTQWAFYDIPVPLEWERIYYWRVRVSNHSTMQLPWLEGGRLLVQQGDAYRSDEFEAGQLQPGWMWIHSVPGYWRWAGPRVFGYKGELDLIVSGGTLVGAANDADGVLVRSMGGTRIVAETHLRYDISMPDSLREQAGMIVYQDDDNFISLVQSDNNGRVVGVGVEYAGQYTWYETPARQHMHYFRIERDGDRYRAYFGDDGLNWSQIGPEITVDWPNPQIGLLAWGGGITHTYDARFGWFRVTDLPAAAATPTATPTATETSAATSTPTATATKIPVLQGQEYQFLPLVIREQEHSAAPLR